MARRPYQWGLQLSWCLQRRHGDSDHGQPIRCHHRRRWRQQRRAPRQPVGVFHRGSIHDLCRRRRRDRPGDGRPAEVALQQRFVVEGLDGSGVWGPGHARTNGCRDWQRRAALRDYGGIDWDRRQRSRGPVGHTRRDVRPVVLDARHGAAQLRVSRRGAGAGAGRARRREPWRRGVWDAQVENLCYTGVLRHRLPTWAT